MNRKLDSKSKMPLCVYVVVTNVVTTATINYVSISFTSHIHVPSPYHLWLLLASATTSVVI